MKLSTRLSPEQSAFMRTITKTTENHVPLTYNGQQIGTCYAEMTSTGVQMVAEIDEETEKRLKGELQQRPTGFSIEGSLRRK